MGQRGRWRIRVDGTVQGVGFRPFVHRLAVGFGLAGHVKNDSRGVTIEVEGEPGAMEKLVASLQSDPPPAAAVESVAVQEMSATGAAGFAILSSETIAGESPSVPPDLAICPDCLRELFDPCDRRYRYPFLNCTHCGPRYTIIGSMPYDRPRTTMAEFAMCAACEREYADPLNRRFHAQPNACPDCGPLLEFQPGGFHGEAALRAAKALLAEERILAVKGLGGFHLACEAESDTAVAELRRRKGRGGKPLALMADSTETVRQFARVSREEEALLESAERPIVLLRRREGGAPLSALVAPGQEHLGFLLAYTPLHHLLLSGRPLVMTSGNRSDEPIARTNAEAMARLDGLADGFLLHNRDIETACDDSVIRVFRGGALPVRRSRGYAPMPVQLPFANPPPALAVGGELKSTFCITRRHRAYLSQHIGDMENVETLDAFERAVGHLQRLVDVKPELVACDLHPGYISTEWAGRTAARLGVPMTRVQHHHAHVAGLMAEHGLAVPEQVLGVAFDGTGFGTDGAIWGGELLLASYDAFERLGHLRYVPLPGGDAAVKKPYRMALAHCFAADIDWASDLPSVRAAAGETELGLLRAQLSRRINCVDTSSVGRLFDAMASLLGVRQAAGYEAQAAMELEALASGRRRPAARGTYAFGLVESAVMQFDPRPLWEEAMADLRAGEPREGIAARFHGAVADLIVRACLVARDRTGVATVALTGGVFQNLVLLEWTLDALVDSGFRVLTHRVTPPNDGGLSLGQAAVAIARQVRAR